MDDGDSDICDCGVGVLVNKTSNIDRKQVEKLLDDGHSIRSIIRQVGLASQTINKISKEYNINKNINLARSFLEAIRWPNGVICEYCNSKNIIKISGGREGLFLCRDCRKQFTVTINTIIQDTHINISDWFNIICGVISNKSCVQISKDIGVTYRSTWYAIERLKTIWTPSRRKIIHNSKNPICDNCKTNPISERSESLRKTARTKHKFCSSYCYAAFYRKLRENDKCIRCGLLRKDKVGNSMYKKKYCMSCYNLLKSFNFMEDFAEVHAVTQNLKETIKNENKKHDRVEANAVGNNTGC